MLHCHLLKNRVSCASAATIAMFVISAAAYGGGVLFVDDDAPLGGDGTTWDTAYRFLQDALADASGGGVTEVRVGQDTYKPDRNEANPDGTGNRFASFHLINGVALMGGYAGIGAKDPDARDIELFETILSGDLLGDDEPDFINNDENSFHVVTGSGTDGTALIEGFIIRSGNSDGQGGGFYSEDGDSILTFCRFEHNMAAEDGGAMYNESSTIVITDCTFYSNRANGSPNFPGGGAVRNQLSTTTFTRCVFNANSSPWPGGAILTIGWTTIVDSAFMNNTSNGSGGAIQQYGGTMDVLDCSFVGNVSSSAGGGICIEDGEATISGCEFQANAATSERGGGVFMIECGVTISDCRFEGNMTSSQGGGVHNEAGSLLIFDCDFSFNHANSRGGGLLTRDINTASFVMNCSFYSNSAGQRGGGLYNQDSDLVVNCVFSGNESPLGGAVYHANGSTPLVNCTFSSNVADDGGGLYIGQGTSPEIRNCVVWGNDSKTGADSIAADGDPLVMFSVIEGGWPGLGNIDTDPLFVDPDNDDYHVPSGSPVIDAADNTAVPKGIDTDLDGNPRFVDDPDTKDTGNGDPPIVDMGAYEFQPALCPWDIDASGSVGASDLLALLASWGPCKGCPADFNGDGNVGASDLLALLANWGPCP